MTRRNFMKSSVALTSAAALSAPLATPAADPTNDSTPEFYELRKYHLRRGPMQKRFDDFYKNAALPAMNRAGITTVGVFGVQTGPDSPTMYVLMPHRTLSSYHAALDKV